MADEEIEGKGFVVRDRRRFTERGEPKEEAGVEREVKPERPQDETREATEAEAKAAAEKVANEAQQAPLPEINFSTFIFSLNTSALLHLGEIPDPASGKEQKDLAMAKQTIDLIAMLEEKTRGNLSPEEENLVKHILYELRLRYVQKSK